MDLSKFDLTDTANTGAAMHVEHPATGEKLYTESDEPVTITLLGIDSDKMKARQHELTNAVLKKGFRAKMPSAEKHDDERITTLALATVSWANIELDGKPLDCTSENARKLYARLPWLADQADAFIADRANFLKA